ncbi:MAG: hypothetical protein Q8R08_03205 [bacterium]|nr:hypothetical protein [bacterium]
MTIEQLRQHVGQSITVSTGFDEVPPDATGTLKGVVKTPKGWRVVTSLHSERAFYGGLRTLEYRLTLQRFNASIKLN